MDKQAYWTARPLHFVFTVVSFNRLNVDTIWRLSPRVIRHAIYIVNSMCRESLYIQAAHKHPYRIVTQSKEDLSDTTWRWLKCTNWTDFELCHFYIRLATYLIILHFIITKYSLYVWVVLSEMLNSIGLFQR